MEIVREKGEKRRTDRQRHAATLPYSDYLIFLDNLTIGRGVV